MWFLDELMLIGSIHPSIGRLVNLQHLKMGKGLISAIEKYVVDSCIVHPLTAWNRFGNYDF